MSPWIRHYRKQGIKEFAIASSGNSAISAARYCARMNLKLDIFVSLSSPALPGLRRRTLLGLCLHVTKTPRKDAIQFCNKNNAINLRASTDDNALIGYGAIARELAKQLPRIDNVFIPTSSGATLEGIYQGFKTQNLKSKTKKLEVPAFYAVQTSRVHPIASCFDKNFKQENKSYASAIVDNIAHRRDRVVKVCRETGGGGFVISNGELEGAGEFLDRYPGLASLTGYNQAKLGWQSVLAFAGFLKWRSQNIKDSKKETSVCLFTD